MGLVVNKAQDNVDLANRLDSKNLSFVVSQTQGNMVMINMSNLKYLDSTITNF
jgi:anti-anti-sigma regulatory factor